MPRPLFDSEYLFGIFDPGDPPGGGALLLQADRPGWVLCAAEIGSDPNNVGGSDFSGYSGRGLGVICRLHNGSEPNGTIPRSYRYEAFAHRCATFVAASQGCRIWIIGNEMNYAMERPGVQVDWSRATLRGGAREVAEILVARGLPERFSALLPASERPPSAIRKPGELITPQMYARCYRLCRDAIHALPGHEEDQVLVGAVTPWNDQTVYPGNPNGDWVLYFQDILQALGPGGCDGICLHTFSHSGDPAEISDESRLKPPFQHRYAGFRAYRDFMAAIPAELRSLPVFITETDQDLPWRDEATGWVQEAYREIHAWNQQPGHQQIRALILHRWPRKDRWGFEDKQGVLDDLRAALQHDYRCHEPVVASETPATVEPPRLPDGTPLSVVDISERLPKGTIPFGLRDLATLRYLVINHTAVRPDVELAQIAHAHVQRGYPGIAYDFVVDAAGQIFQVNNLTLTVQADKEWSGKGLNICLAGNFSAEAPPPAQLQAAADLCAWLADRFQLPLSAVVGAGELLHYDSPGRTFYSGPGWKERLLALIRARLEPAAAYGEPPILSSATTAEAAPAAGSAADTVQPTATAGSAPQPAAAAGHPAPPTATPEAAPQDALPPVAQADAQSEAAAPAQPPQPAADETPAHGAPAEAAHDPASRPPAPAGQTELSVATATDVDEPIVPAPHTDEPIEPAPHTDEAIEPAPHTDEAVQGTPAGEADLAAVPESTPAVTARPAPSQPSPLRSGPTAPAAMPPEVKVVINRLPRAAARLFPRTADDIRYLVINHTAVPAAVPLERIAQAHKVRLPGILYHFYVDGQGGLFQTQPLMQVVDNSQPHIRHGIHIAFAGNLIGQAPTAAQLTAAARLIAWLKTQFPQLSDSHIQGVQELASDPGPGDQWMSGLNWKQRLLTAVAHAEQTLGLPSQAARPRRVTPIPRPSISDRSHELARHPTLRYGQRARSQISHLAIHHTAIQAEVGPERIAVYHTQADPEREKDAWPGIGFHYFVHADGTIDQCNPLETVCYHVHQHNGYTVGIALGGRFVNGALPPAPQLEATAHLVAWLLQELEIPPERVWGHRDFPDNRTICPGSDWSEGKQWRRLLLEQVEQVQSRTAAKVLHHCLLLPAGTQSETLLAAGCAPLMAYIRHFRPALVFDVTEAIAAIYVTLIGGDGEIGARLRGAGCLVEALAAAEPEQLEALLAAKVAAGRQHRDMGEA